MFWLSEQNLMGNKKFQGTISMKSGESPEDRWFYIAQKKFTPGFSVLISRLGNHFMLYVITYW